MSGLKDTKTADGRLTSKHAYEYHRQVYIWPRVIYNRANINFLHEDNPSIVESLAEDPSLWGFSMEFHEGPVGNNCSPVGRMNWYRLGKHGLILQTPTQAADKQARAFLECLENSEAHHFCARQALRDAPSHPKESPFQAKDNGTMLATYTRVGFLMHSKRYKNKEFEDKSFLEGEQVYTPEVHQEIVDSRSHHFGASCLTLLLGETPRSNHAKLQYHARIRETMKQHLKHLTVLSNSSMKFILHPDWKIPKDDNW